MAPSWLNLSAHLNKSNVGCVPAVASFFSSPSPSPFLSASSPSRGVSTRLAFAVFIARGASIHPLVPTRTAFSDSGSADIFAQYLKRLLMEIAIMPSVLPPLPRVDSFERLDSCLPRLSTSFPLAAGISFPRGRAKHAPDR